MSATAAVWVALAATLVLLSVRRPVYAVSFYMMTFFAAPHLWWWGDDLPGLRYAGIAGLVLLVTVILHRSQSTDDNRHRFTTVHKLGMALALNATFVHFAIASTPDVSVDNYVELLKLVLLVFVMWGAIQNRRDLRVVMMSIALGAAYIGYEVTYNERGYFDGGRLEGVGAPGAESSNSLANVMLLSLPLIGSLFIEGNRYHKLTAIAAGPLALNVILLCNSRGGFLGLAGAAASFLLVARGPTRKRAIQSLALGGITLFLLLGDPQILERFATTFSGDEARDRSAASRLEFWQAGFLMLQDYPLGDGGGSFKYVHGGKYLSQVVGGEAADRSLHNGYLTEATEWGIQGLFLRLLFLGAALRMAFRTNRLCRQEGRVNDALMGVCIIVAAAGYLIHCFFGSFISNEWGYWIVVLLVRYGELYEVPEAAQVTVHVEQPRELTGTSPAWAPSGASAVVRS
jgi:putative inorganic carbon (hco3(-)) transporter